MRALTKGDGHFVLELDVRRIEADQVVVATGPFQQPRTPEFADELAPEVAQRRSTEYRNPGDLPPGRVRVLGRDLFWWLDRAGLMRRSTSSRIGRRMRRRDPVLVGSSPSSMARQGVRLRPRAVAASGRTIGFEDGSQLEVDAVIWATGYRPEHSWISVPAIDREGRLRHRRGVTDTPGLYLLGLSWQHTRGSALLGWVKEDAEYIARRVGEFPADHARPSSPQAGERAHGSRRPSP